MGVDFFRLPPLSFKLMNGKTDERIAEKPITSGFSATILVVDDTMENLQVLGGFLKEWGYRIRPAKSGKLALAAVHSAVPDLVLLDINMPEMDGYEVCRRFKSDLRLRDVPVIFITALNDTEAKVRAFGCGGVDFVTKPFQAEEVRARIETHLTLSKLQKELKNQNLELKTAYERVCRLESMRDDLTRMIVHDLRSPFQSILSNLEFVKSTADHLDDEQSGSLEQAGRSVSGLLSLVDDIIDVGRLEEGQMPMRPEETDPGKLVDEAVAGLAWLKPGHEMRIVRPSEPVRLLADPVLLRRVIGNLVANALKFSPRGKPITVAYGQTENDEVLISIADRGPGIPAEYRDRIFEKYVQVQAQQAGARASSGLGLPFCRLAVDAHGGRIEVESEVGKGSVFTVVLPRNLPTCARSGKPSGDVS